MVLYNVELAQMENHQVKDQHFVHLVMLVNGLILVVIAPYVKLVRKVVTLQQDLLPASIAQQGNGQSKILYIQMFHIKHRQNAWSAHKVDLI